MKIEFDEGYSFGKGAFETIKVINKNPLFLDEHLLRLKKSLDFFEIDIDIRKEKIYQYIEDTKLNNFALKIIVSDKNIILTHREDNYRKDDKSFKLKISKVKRNSTSKLVYHKSLCYYENIFEHKIALKEGYDSSVFLNERDEVAETSFANIFFVKDNNIYTPALSCGLLKGTMRDYLLEKYKIYTAIIKLDEIDNFDECFISNSLMGVRNVISINEIEFTNQNMTKIIQKNLKKIGF